ncbi:unnamed protein product [Leptidea sinapis]|uniref:UBR-type domain-containing protein n=1 Tax=Leptidea sinapis TaxID=189913 RepID=A0A5E4R6C7_9NEOP|nr:unnamed protein product [Leptidea sinapis]
MDQVKLKLIYCEPSLTSIERAILKDEDAMLQYKLCTFTVTNREFMNQHWYHCHSCKMVDGVGVCTVCARVCHRGHDVSYANYFTPVSYETSGQQLHLHPPFQCVSDLPYSGFFDVLTMTESLFDKFKTIRSAMYPYLSCQALERRSGALGAGARGPGPHEAPPAPALRRRPSSPAPAALVAPPRRTVLAHNIQGCRPFLAKYDKWEWCLERVRRLVCSLLGPVRAECERHAPVGAHGRAQRALAMLHLGEKLFFHTDKLVTPTLGSQEGAFENVRMSFTGENGQTIRQLMSAHKLRRVAMCCLASPQGRRQYLAVSHEKGKITVLQLSALLKQVDSSKHKLTLTRLSSAPIPFTVISLSGTPANDDLLAVCGLKECHVLTFNSGVSFCCTVAEHLVLTTGLDATNYIIKSIWLPGSQTQLALVTSDFVKIFDLSKDLNNPMHHFLIPSGKVRDVTFVSHDGMMHMLCMSSAGHIYWQPMSRESRASLGTFYVTNTLEVLHPEIQMLFFSYSHGKSFLAPLNTFEDSVKGTAMITVNAGPKEGGRGKSGVQSLVQWAEVPGHPGLVTALMQASNNPVVVPAKAKITDMVAVRHAGGGPHGEQKTTIIVLCEDGSLRMYATGGERLDYWLAPAMRPVHVPRRRVHRRAAPHAARKQFLQKKLIFPFGYLKVVAKSNTNGSPQFPIDFFEHCVTMTEIEFGGNDLLQVYNTGQIKHRLNTTGLYVVSTKMSGFSLEVINSDSNMVICGIRILLGSQDVARTPTYVEFVVTNSLYRKMPRLACAALEALELGAMATAGAAHSGVEAAADAARSLLCVPASPLLHARAQCLLRALYQNNYHQYKTPSCSSGQYSAILGMVTAMKKDLEQQRDQLLQENRAIRNRLTHSFSKTINNTSDKRKSIQKRNNTDYLISIDQAVARYVCSALRELRHTPDARNIDPEAYFRLLLMARELAMYYMYSGDWSVLWKEGSPEAGEPHLLVLLASVLWRLAECRREARGPPGLLVYGLRHVEHTLHALADVVHAFQLHAHPDCIEFGNQIYLSLLLAEDQDISFGAKTALMRVLRPRVKRRRVYIPSPPNTPAGPSTASQPAAPESESRKLHALRVSLLSAALSALPALSALAGVRVIPFVQVVLMLAGDLDSSVEGDRAVLDRLLEELVSELDIRSQEAGVESRDVYLDANANGQTPPIHVRTNRRELQLIIMRLLSHALDVFDNYPQLLMEMALRLPCQIHKHCDPAHFDSRWRTLLCEYMMNQQTPLRKQVRKLLLLLCGTRERYRHLRDVHALDTHLNAARALLDSEPAYDELVRLMDHLKSCAEIVSARTGNWQSTCCAERRESLAWLLCAARRVHPHVAPALLQLLQAALCAPGPAPGSTPGPAPAKKLLHGIDPSKSDGPDHLPGIFLVKCSDSICVPITILFNKSLACKMAYITPVHKKGAKTNISNYRPISKLCIISKPSTEWPERERSADSDAMVFDGSKFQEHRVPQLVSPEELKLFIKAFLLETNSTAVRWQAHALLLAIYNNCSETEQASLVSLLWSIWPSLPQYGRKAAQFVDLLGYFTLKTSNIDTEGYVRSAVELLRNQNKLLTSHGNAALYAALAAYVELEGYFLESEPCLVCNNPEVPMATIKLPTIKFTTTTQIVKLVNSQMISRISLRIGDIKRSKMVRTINFNVAQSEACPAAGGTERGARGLPATHRGLQPHDGVRRLLREPTGHRAINYDEKDPFLCHACGFCKYAKFDYTLIARPCCAVDTIDNDEDRKKIKELIAYDKAQCEQQKGEALPAYAIIMKNYDGDRTKESGSSCYGCSLATAEHCLTLLRALASQRPQRAALCGAGLLLELVHHNLHRGTPQSQEEVRSLICLVTRDNLAATEQLCKLLTQRITLSLLGHAASQDHNNSVRPLVLLLGSLVKMQDSIDCWETRLRCIVKLWVWLVSHILITCVVYRCCPQVTEVAGIAPATAAILKDDLLADMPGINASSPNCEFNYTILLAHQYALQQVGLPCLRYMQELMAPLTDSTPAATAATATVDQAKVLILLTSFLPDVGAAGEASEQFLQLYQRYALKRLTELLGMFLEEAGARRTYKGRLVGAVLGGYLSLRRLVVQRTRSTDSTQERLLELLEEMTTVEPGMGPLMRDVKNKICTDCELVALLEDDNGMELLVCNKIMSLDLPVWCTSGESVDAMRVVYRMRGLLGDATEEFVETLSGLEVMLQRLSAISRVGGARVLASTLLRLLSLCVRVRRCVLVLTRGDTSALPFSLTFGGPEHVQALLNCTELPAIRNNPSALGHLMRVLAALVYGNDLKMAMLVDHFKKVLDFERLDSEQWTDEEFRMELFCVLCANIERNSVGGTLKDYLISLGVVRDALDYIIKRAPCVKPTLVCTDSDELKEFISKPALKFILRFLTGLAHDHEPTQMLVCEKVIPIVHRLEQVSSGEHVLGIYTFTKRCPVEEYEVRARKTLGFTTVSHYNIVHVECHLAAVRQQRARTRVVGREVAALEGFLSWTPQKLLESAHEAEGVQYYLTLMLMLYPHSNDEPIAKAAERVVSSLTDELLPCTTFAEFCDAAGLLGDIPEPDTFLQRLIDDQP